MYKRNDSQGQIQAITLMRYCSGFRDHLQSESIRELKNITLKDTSYDLNGGQGEFFSVESVFFNIVKQSRIDR